MESTMPNYRRHYLPGHPVFLTVVTHRRQPWLATSGHAEGVLSVMRQVRLQYPFRHLAHVLMPDHLHWMLTPADGQFSRIFAAMKREVTWR
jgi:putative transposase